MNSAASIVTTCKGRLSHLKQSINGMLSQNCEIVVVDFGCPDHAADWCESQNHSLIKTIRGRHDTEHFNPARARNIGARHSSGDYLFFCDADIMLPDNFVASAIEKMQINNVDLCLPTWSGTDGQSGDDLNGQCIVSTSAWESISGYNEKFEGYSHEDIDFYRRLEFAGHSRVLFRNHGMGHIEHGDMDSMRFFKKHDKAMSLKSNYRRMLSRTWNSGPVNPNGFGVL